MGALCGCGGVSWGFRRVGWFQNSQECTTGTRERSRMTPDPSLDRSRVTREDLEAELRATAGTSGDALAKNRAPIAMAGILLGIAVIALAWAAGRRVGRLRSTVVEVRRI